jgi:hypothetical protein
MNDREVVSAEEGEYRMKAIYLMMCTCCLIILTGCSKCGYPTDCWKGYFKDTQCGIYVQSPCEKICDGCTFNEPSCQACRSCVDHDGCGYGDIGMCGRVDTGPGMCGKR